MNGEPELVTVYRSMDATAKSDCETIASLLTDEGLTPLILDDSAPGVPEGTYELRVPADQAARAERLIADNPLPDEVEQVDDSAYLDLSEAIYHAEGSTSAEFEANSIKSVLEANGIASVVIGDSVLPNFPFEVRVAEENADKAREIIESFAEGGSAAADQAELESEAAGAKPDEP